MLRLSCLRTYFLGLSLLFVTNGLGLCAAFGQESAAEAVDFVKQIQPILETKCYSCHGPALRSGGLRLDRRDEVLAGGYSQKPLVGGTLETNEIYLRVTSDDAGYRMPKGNSPLTSDEIGLFKRWVEHGGQWASAMPVVKDGAQAGWLDKQAWLNYLERWLKEVPGLIPWLLTLLGMMLTLLLIERFKQASVKGKPWTARRPFRWLEIFRSFGLVHFLLIITLMGWVLTLLISRGQQVRVEELAQELRIRQGQTNGGSSQPISVYGNPPIPQHPGHPPRLRGEYYRGNCERSPKLFNGGNYRTATLRVSLIDSEGRDVNYGDQIATNGLSIRFELDRAPGTTPALFSEAYVKRGVFLTPQLLTEELKPLDLPAITLTEIKPEWKWEAIVRLKGPHDSATTSLSGLIYVYQGSIEGSKARGTLHYGIKYDLSLKELILQPDSQVWLGSLFWTPTIEHPTQGKVPLTEWFDDKPIPEMTGENSTDPKLLGIP